MHQGLFLVQHFLPFTTNLPPSQSWPPSSSSSFPEHGKIIHSISRCSSDSFIVALTDCIRTPCNMTEIKVYSRRFAPYGLSAWSRFRLIGRNAGTWRKSVGHVCGLIVGPAELIRCLKDPDEVASSSEVRVTVVEAGKVRVVVAIIYGRKSDAVRRICLRLPDHQMVKMLSSA